jgi:hypothetical protein
MSGASCLDEPPRKDWVGKSRVSVQEWTGVDFGSEIPEGWVPFG